jgi:hypothetical protein
MLTILEEVKVGAKRGRGGKALAMHVNSFACPRVKLCSN